jgi:hypothetical protein
MILLRFALRANDLSRRAAEREGGAAPDPVPALKLFNPCGPATWLATELDRDGVAGSRVPPCNLFGLADLGFGCPELGYFSLSEIAAVRLPFGLRIERDEGFATAIPLSAWAEAARRAGSIASAESHFRRAANQPPDAELPSRSEPERYG